MRKSWSSPPGLTRPPHWQRDGKELFYISPDWKMMAVNVAVTPASESGTPHALLGTQMVETGIRIGPMSWGIPPDGKRFLIISDNSMTPTDAYSLSMILNWRPEKPRLDSAIHRPNLQTSDRGGNSPDLAVDRAPCVSRENDFELCSQQFSYKGLPDDLLFCDDGSPACVAKDATPGSISKIDRFLAFQQASFGGQQASSHVRYLLMRLTQTVLF